MGPERNPTKRPDVVEPDRPLLAKHAERRDAENLEEIHSICLICTGSGRSSPRPAPPEAWCSIGYPSNHSLTAGARRPTRRGSAPGARRRRAPRGVDPLRASARRSGARPAGHRSPGAQADRPHPPDGDPERLARQGIAGERRHARRPPARGRESRLGSGTQVCVDEPARHPT
jgi:hypothetical protein